jgi:hypothetical protein
VFIIETVQVEVPDGMFKGGNGFGCGFEAMVKFDGLVVVQSLMDSF